MKDSAKWGIQGGIDAIPVLIYAFVFGVSFGLLAQQLDIPSEAVLMSFLWFSGVAQYTSLQLMLDGTSTLFSISLTAILINSRHVLMGVSLYKYFGYSTKPSRLFFLHFLVDESWLYSLNKYSQNSKIHHFGYFAGFGLCAFLGWFIGSAFGAYYDLGFIEAKKYGIDYISVGLFMCVLYSQYDRLSRLIWWVACALTTVFLSTYIPYGLGPVIAAIGFAYVYTEAQNLRDARDSK